MDQSPKARVLIQKYEREIRNNKWFRVILDRLQRLTCCVRDENETFQESHCGDGDIQLELPPCLVEISTFYLDGDTEIRSLTCQEESNEQSKLTQFSLRDLPTDACYNSKSSGLPQRRRRHAFYQANYSGGFQSFVGDQ